MLRGSMRNFLENVETNYGGEKETAFVDVVAVIIGFLLIRREVSAFFDLKMDEKVFLNEIYLLVARQIRGIIAAHKQTQTVLTLK
jgi:hypothetical protein